MFTRNIIEYKQLQAAQEERDAGVAFFQKDAGTKSTLHFDTNSRNNIDGEWPSLILNFLNTQHHRLRALFFAYEDRANIILLIIETYERLAVAATVETYFPVSACILWGKTDSVMTNAVTKNLSIEVDVSEHFGTDYKPYHLLCKSHTVEIVLI